MVLYKKKMNILQHLILHTIYNTRCLNKDRVSIFNASVCKKWMEMDYFVDGEFDSSSQFSSSIWTWRLLLLLFRFHFIVLISLNWKGLSRLSLTKNTNSYCWCRYYRTFYLEFRFAYALFTFFYLSFLS